MELPRQVGRYLVRGEVGRGGMGVVYRAEDPTLGRDVAVKVISPPAGHPLGEELELRFLREARLAARVNHPGVVTVHDAGSDGGMLYLVMELVEGESLKVRLDRGLWPSRAQALGIVAQVADALAAAHALGVVHRDVKPANILMTRDGAVKVSDFGIAKAVGDATEMTRAGTTLGSPAYMAPEQVRGDALDPRADLFSLGVVLYELLLRRRPFAAETITTLVYQILHHDPLSDESTRGQLGVATAELLAVCLAKEPEQRIPDAATLARRALELAPQQPAEMADVVPTVAFFPPPLPPAPPSSGGAAGAPAGPPTVVVERDEPPRPARPGWLLWAVGAVALAGLGLAAGGLLLFSAAARRAVPLEGAGAPPVSTAVVEVAAVEEREAIAPTATAPRAETTAVRPEVAPSTPVATRVAPPALPPTPTGVALPVPTPARTPTPVLARVYICSRAADFDVQPDDAEIEVNGELIGIADDWDNAGGGQLYTFAGPGTYYVRLSRPPSHEPAWVKIVVTPHASREVAAVDLKLQRVR